MSSIKLDPELGVNPRLMECAVCGGEVNGIVLLGISNHKTECLDCGVWTYGKRGRKCGACGSSNWGQRIKLKSGEKIPDICDYCRKAEAEAIETESQMGGVHILCAECGMRGVIKHDHPMCAEVRKAHGPEYMVRGSDGVYKACGVELGSCSEHGC
jgi:hypothetical protein